MPDDQPWVMDSGAKRNYTNFELPNFRRIRDPPAIGTASGDLLFGKSIGNIPVTNKDQLPIKHAMFAPGLQRNLLSVGVVCDSTEYCMVHTSSAVFAVPRCELDLSGYARVAHRGPDTGHMYYVNKEYFGIPQNQPPRSKRTLEENRCIPSGTSTD